MVQLLDLEIIEAIREVGDFRENDAFALELFELFAEQSEMAARELLQSIERGDLAQIRYFAHRLKGSAANIGACALSQCAEQVEESVRGGTLEAEFLRGVTAELPKLRLDSLEALRRILLGAEANSDANERSLHQ